MFWKKYFGSKQMFSMAASLACPDFSGVTPLYFLFYLELT